ncbi:MAG: TrmH family RNA methyltransferase, partial [Alistipes sp.]|nr:TrmH family RNA methyltransferase [Alistipes sp.]
ALGAEMTVPWEYAPVTIEAVERLKAEGYRVLAIEQVEGSVMLNEFRAEEGVKYALVFGNEVAGVDQAVVDLVDGSIEIPQVGTKHSINVSVSGGVVLWNFFCQIGVK